MHRFIMNAPDGKVIDHINHNTLDNRKENLKVCTQKDNLKNRLPNSNKHSSQYRGVSRYHNGTWVAHYGHQAIGYFKHEEDAAIDFDIYLGEVN
jgi:hypothetical protein